MAHGPNFACFSRSERSSRRRRGVVRARGQTDGRTDVSCPKECTLVVRPHTGSELAIASTHSACAYVVSKWPAMVTYSGVSHK